MVRRAFKNAGRKAVIGAVAVSAIFAGAGVASAETAVPEPVAVQQISGGIPLEIATDPNAQNSDPLANGAAAGAAAGAVGSAATNAAACLLVPGAGSVAAPACALAGAVHGAMTGTIIGLLVGAVSPQSVPQVLP
ncbi:Uncharacterised protein [Nocardia otitidiscaviarum]|uniref:Uncharacterized protein n=1 Tax=Nocardia otitidiscaviarum TaxID=1823 RepID=A0A378YBI4_9NOCA|nr:hypothetical protein [Nocardia otitidiscaviarum]MBF6239904.1 hypothetical protein [Nocardia otitidiscaviarum]SUA73719.1 Uncharacterised protein [Nocardia otitidiscaviarum]